MRHGFGTTLSAAALVAGIAMAGLAASTAPALAQQGMMRDTYSPFTQRESATALNRALLMRQMERGTANAGVNGSGDGSGTAYVNNYSSQTVGNLNNISNILDGGAQAYISTGQDQQGTQASGTQGNQQLNQQLQAGSSPTGGTSAGVPLQGGAGAPGQQQQQSVGH